MRDRRNLKAGLSRRRFLGSLAGAAAAPSPMAVGAGAGPSGAPAPDKRSRVVAVRDPKVMNRRNRPDPKAVRAMVDKGLLRLTGRESVKAAWRELVSPDDVIGLKVNCLGKPRLCTHPAFAEAVAESLAAAGVPAKQIVIWDRMDRELSLCGYRLNKSGAGRRCLGTTAYEDEEVDAGGIATRLSTLVTRETTAQINLPVLKSHSLAGFSGALKNELGCIHNARNFHVNHCRAAADVSALEPIDKKRRLVVCDALRPLYDKGPMDMPACRWNHGALIFSTDPVAADLVGRRIIEEKRRAVRGGKPWPLLPPAAHLDRAIELGLGAASLDTVELIEI